MFHFHFFLYKTKRFNGGLELHKKNFIIKNNLSSLDRIKKMEDRKTQLKAIEKYRQEYEKQLLISKKKAQMEWEKKKKKVIEVLENLEPIQFTCIGGVPEIDRDVPHYVIDTQITEFKIQEFTQDDLKDAIEEEKNAINNKFLRFIFFF